LKELCALNEASVELADIAVKVSNLVQQASGVSKLINDGGQAHQ